MGALRPRKDGQPPGELLTFDQREFTFPASLASYSLAETGYAYMPASCAALEPCGAHVALHGCKHIMMRSGLHSHAGYNEWADTSHLIILARRLKFTPVRGRFSLRLF